MTGVLSRVADQLAGSAYESDPVGWAQSRLDVFLWSKQREILESLSENRRTAVHTCYTIGKTYSAAVACCWWIDTHRAGDAFIVTTATSGAQVKAALWREINRLHKRGGLPGRTNLTEWYLGGELVGIGRKPSEYNPDAFQGLHAKAMLVVLDEASGVPETLWDAAAGLASNEHSRVLAIGNPAGADSHFARVCEVGSGWNTIHVSYADTPNFSDEDVPAELADTLIGPTYVEEQRQQHGEDSPWYAMKVLGEFVEDVEERTIPSAWLAACKDLGLEPEGRREAGLDVSEGAADESVLWWRIGAVPQGKFKWRISDAMGLVGEVVSLINELDLQVVKVDTIGDGWGVYSRLLELRREGEHGAEIVSVKASERARDPKRFLNVRAEMWWECGRELARAQAVDYGNVDDETLADLVAPNYAKNSAGRIVIESKEDVKKRLGRSTDSADAFLMMLYQGKPRGSRTKSPVGRTINRTPKPSQPRSAGGSRTMRPGGRVRRPGPRPPGT